MVDLIPEGSISLSAAYDLFALNLWNGHSPVAELSNENIYKDAHPFVVANCRAFLSRITDRMLGESVRAFASGSLDALVRPLGSAENFAIPADSWSTVHFPERVFLSAEIAHNHGGYWDALVGRTPFVRRAQFDSWLSDQIARRNNLDAIPSPAVRALKDQLITLAMNGLVSSAEVETFAQEWGLPPLASKTDAAAFDPLRLSRWTLCMAVSWVVWGTIDDVRDVMDDYRSSCWEWVSFHRRLPIDGGGEWYEVRGEELQTRQPTSVSAIGMLEACRDDPRETAKRMTVKCAREDLWRLLGEGELDASGLNPAGQISEIPAHEWSYLELASKLNGADYLVFSHDTAKSAYSKVTISRARLLEQWPARSEPQPLEKGERNVQLDAKRRKLEATRHALLDLYPGGVPSGLTDKQRLDAVNRWHRQKGNTEVSTTTIRRALAGM